MISYLLIMLKRTLRAVPLLLFLLPPACACDEECDSIDGAVGCSDDEDCESCWAGCWSYLAEEADGGEIDWSNVEWYCDFSEGPVVMDTCGNTRPGTCKDRYIDDE